MPGGVVINPGDTDVVLRLFMTSQRADIKTQVHTLSFYLSPHLSVCRTHSQKMEQRKLLFYFHFSIHSSIYIFEKLEFLNQTFNKYI